MTAKEYLKQFTPEQLLEVYKKVFHKKGAVPDDVILAPDGWKCIAPIWMVDFEQPGMMTLQDIRQQGGFRDTAAEGVTS